jgi:short-subunit dehydrogenase
VLLVARIAERLERVRAEIEATGGTAHVHPADLSRPSKAARRVQPKGRDVRPGAYRAPMTTGVETGRLR